MIRLNDIDKTVIDESKVVAYYGYEEEKTYCISIVLSNRMYVEYNSQEARDKDIELLDKIFDVKSIEDKANAYPDEIDALKFAMSGIKQESKLVSEGEYDPVKKEEYLTWKDVKQYATKIQVKLPNGETYRVFYDIDYARIRFYSPYGDNFNGAIYDEDLFNALMLKKVE